MPGPGLLPHQPRPKPRLYSNEEITKLQQATSQLWKPGSLSQLTGRTFVFRFFFVPFTRDMIFGGHVTNIDKKQANLLRPAGQRPVLPAIPGYCSWMALQELGNQRQTALPNYLLRTTQTVIAVQSSANEMDSTAVMR